MLAGDALFITARWDGDALQAGRDERDFAFVFDLL
jgi:hypothetical protein